MIKHGLLLLLFTLIGCENSTVNSPILGSWITQSCQQLTDFNGELVNFWAKSEYTFDASSNIHMQSTSYSDSNCISKSNTIQEEPHLVANFIDQGDGITQQGIDANKITIIFSTIPPPVITTSGYYKITNNQLCLSQSYHFNSASFGIGTVDDTEIDFSNCLENTTH
jgi:hypothetical protein